MELPNSNDSIFGYVVLALITFWAGFKIRYFQAKKMDAESWSAMRANYVDYVSDHKSHYEELKSMFLDSKTKLEIVSQESINFQLKIKDLERQNNVLEIAVEVWKKKYDDMCDKVDKFEKSLKNGIR